MNKYAYYAELAGLYYTFSATGDAFTIKLQGFNEKSATLLQAILQTMMIEEVKEEVFNRILEETQRKFRNRSKFAPYKHVLSMLDYMMNLDSNFWTEVRDALDLLTLDTYVAMRKVILESFYLQTFVMGNVTCAATLEIVATINKILKFSPATLASLKPPREINLPTGACVLP